MKKTLNLKDFLQGENLYIEYKDDSGSHFSDSKIYESAVGMANASGGRIFIGITDSGSVKGSQRIKSKFWQTPQIVEAIILQHTSPHLSTRAFLVPYQDLQVLCIEVPKSPFTIRTSSGKFIKRELNSKGVPYNRAMQVEEIISNIPSLGSTDFSSTILKDIYITEIDLNLVEKEIQRIKRQLDITSPQRELAFLSQPPIDILKTMGLLNKDEQPNIAGLLTFGREDSIRERLPNAFVQYQVFGQRGEVLRNERYTEPIVTLLPKLLSQPELNQNSDEFIYLGRNAILPEYSKQALREAIANALVHRDYTKPNSIQIQVFPNEIMITSPGGFPMGVSMDNLLSVAPTPRNRRLADSLYRMNLVESSGRGIDFIFYGQAKYGRPTPDYSQSNDDQVSISLAGGKANLDFCKLVFSLNIDLSINEMLLLNLMFIQRDITLNESSKYIQKPLSQTKSILMGMYKNGLIESLQSSQETFFLKSSISPFTRKALIPKRLSSLEKIKYKEQIIQVLKRRKTLTRTELADSLGLSKPQVYRLMKELEEKQKVQLLKSKKWSLLS